MKPEKPEGEETHIKLNADKRAVLARQIKEVSQGLATLLFFLDSEDGLPISAAGDIVSTTEHRFQEIGQSLNVPTKSGDKIERRSLDLRRANMRIRELEEIIGKGQGPEATQMGIKVLFDQITSWWKLEGFGHISDFGFGEYNLRVTFSCHLFGNFPVLNSERPVSDKERKQLWLESLRQRGFVIKKEDREKRVEDCQQTRDALKALFALRLPGSTIWKFESHESRNGSEMDSVTVIIRKIEEILTLPVLPEGAEE